VLALALLGGGCGGEGGDSPDASDATSDDSTPAPAAVAEELDLRVAARSFASCLSDEGLELPGPGAGPGSRLAAVRELDPGDGAVAEAVRACFPEFAGEFEKAGLRPPTQGTVAATAPETVLAEPGEPFYDGDFADPFILRAGSGEGETYLYATNTLFQNVPVSPLPAEPGELVVTEAMPELPAWTEPGLIWAPAVAAVDGGYALYFTSRHRASGRQCIGVATAPAPTGPFVATSDEPLICPLQLGGAIDASPVRDGDATYVVWKSDGNCCGIPTSLFVQETSADGTTLVGEPIELLGSDQGWEGDLVEAPSLVATAEDRWLLLYSANRWDTADYAVGLALCASVTGPCTKPTDGPWLASYATAAGPGGQEPLVTADGTAHVVYHGWEPGTIGYANGGVRRLYLEPVDISTEIPALSDL
jgi:GH43 family beta-xylosidase